ncbi:MAG: hypothetical protein CMM47_10265 [Rhodospirillaceae bacterium]|nr:hypothetical protein [Rhodospirillaceae bacterium]
MTVIAGPKSAMAIHQNIDWIAGAAERLQERNWGMTWAASEIQRLIRSGDALAAIEVSRHGGGPFRLWGYALFRAVATDGELLSLAVHRSTRRSGVGTRLLRKCRDELLSLGCDRLFLEVHERNRGALSFYYRFGFRRSGRRSSYFNTNNNKFDALILEIYLR